MSAAELTQTLSADLATVCAFSGNPDGVAGGKATEKQGLKGRGFTTPLPQLDAALVPHLSRGNLILIAGLSGGGKTILAGQLTADFVSHDFKVLFISSEVADKELLLRMHSAVCEVPYCDIMDGKSLVFPALLDLPVPDPAIYGANTAEKGIALAENLKKSCTFDKYSSGSLQDAVANFHRRQGCVPDVIMVDYLCYPEDTCEKRDEFAARKAVEDATQLLKSIAVDQNILVIAFCQANPCLVNTKKITPQDISDFNSIHKLADAFVGISRRYNEEEEGGGSPYNPIQHFMVSSKTKPEPTMVPVVTNFNCQRFETYVPAVSSVARKTTQELEQQARLVQEQSEYSGYVLARRGTLTELFGCGVNYAANLYAFLLLASKFQEPDIGSSFYGRDKIRDHLGLSGKMIQRATKELEKRGIISTQTRPRSSLVYRFPNWASEQHPENKGYFKLFRNLRDDVRCDLLGDPILFRLWLRCLNKARWHDDEPAQNFRGEIMLWSKSDAEALHMTKVEFNTSLEKLVHRGSLQPVKSAANKFFVANWELYQGYVCPRRS